MAGINGGHTRQFANLHLDRVLTVPTIDIWDVVFDGLHFFLQGFICRDKARNPKAHLHFGGSLKNVRYFAQNLFAICRVFSLYCSNDT